MHTLHANVSTDNLNANRLDPDQALPNVGPDLAGVLLLILGWGPRGQ